ncbi:MAG: mechanosensitive ion channel [Microcoleus sp. PH2017_10_PVI_O_A]|uniref:mechanosensitive ion channel family protein n=1 Tax=unclassified Microcoleus TaxID=2642155 RepID=UPI001D368AE7|nr:MULTISPECIES: mechanosensitive ion channel family protein [unclassified Microcoleus]TAE83225.1 MAG: small-conductance mechanosensitive channel [Oscillatoriales cyanobacterium]MCC3406308.1 mechanosensitive ion channel [Microcoleus sp. PH2017_10_PVI_O_A]MCC3460291.1 mechanosensitive ion channel [Microcoleus sp. PH2017_11_PCY_U_A]MCC3478825.1 mechanosensitive ion channel [Microcoleus sp. PH2017_12_PCY_D_A]MCC3559759.1 mechanosensitive ion channel [Microcoleus sp. PH2017_27_LUM_O_A]
MSNLRFSNDWQTWAVIVGLGFPLLVVLLGEVIYHLQRRGKPFATTLVVVKNLVLPVLMLMIFIRNVLKLDVNDNFSKLVATLFWISVIYAFLSLLNVILFEEAEANTWRARMPKLLIDLSKFFLVLLGTAIVLAAVWGADLAGLATGLGVSSIVIGLALQDTLGSVMSGMALLLERPFSVGDWLRIGNIEGQVVDINWRSVRLLTPQRQMIIVPHQFIGKGIIHNYSQPERIYNQRLNIGFSYDSPPNLVKQVLISTALATQGVLAEPEPMIKTKSYDETAIMYEVEFFIKNFEDGDQILDRFMTRIWYAAQRNNLTLYRYRYSYAVEAADKADSVSSKLAQNLHSIPGFMPLAREPKNLDDLAKGTILQKFGAGEKVIHQGELGNALYIIIAGQAKVTITNKFGMELEVMTILRGEFFGEMALFSGEPSPVSIAAVDDLQVLVIYSDAVNTMIERQPSLGREIGQIIESRSKALSRVQQADV